jgi:hypothetical protein
MTGLFSLVMLFVAQAASAQPRWGRDRMPQTGACFFEDTNYRGRYFCVPRGDDLTSIPSGMGDKISSIRLLGAGDVIVFRDSNMRGRSAEFSRDVADLRRTGWNDQFSSIDVGGRNNRNVGFGNNGNGNGGYRNGNGAYRNGNDGYGNNGGFRANLPVWGRNEQMPRNGACFYEDVNFGGRYFCLQRGASYESLPSGFNDRISSVRLFGSRVELFRDRDFRGKSTQVRGDARNLRGSWGDTISSIRVF